MRSGWAPGGIGLVLLASLGTGCPDAVTPTPRQDILADICADAVPPDPRLSRKYSIPVGCELVDCCPGCPAPTTLDWRIQVGGGIVDSVVLDFDGLPGSGPLSVSGSATAAANRATVGPGVAEVRDLPVAVGGSVPVASLQIELDPVAVAQVQNTRLAGDAPEKVEIRVEQRLGTTVVNEFALHYELRRCLSAGSCDIVTQPGKVGADDAVILLDGRREGVCRNDEIHRAMVEVAVGNLESPGSCSSTLAVFAQANALGLVEDATFTDLCGDQVDVALGPLLDVPVNVWVAVDDVLSQLVWKAPALDVAAMDLAKAADLYDRNKAGLAFQESIERAAISIKNTTDVTAACSGFQPQGTASYVDGELNVYYVPLPFKGSSCSGDRNVILLGLLRNDATLAHEFGHAFSLYTALGGHSDGDPGFTPQNIMWGGGSAFRDHFSLGQVFRFNLASDSQVNENGHGTGNARPCEPKDANDDCPRLALDWR